MPPPPRRLTFFSLPLKLRTLIYKNALIAKRGSQIMPLVKRDEAKETLVPSLLRTCKAIYSEAAPILYSENIFLIDWPRDVRKWFERIGPTNIRYLKSIRIFVPAVYEKGNGRGLFSDPRTSASQWYTLLEMLAAKATGLRNVYIHLDAETTTIHWGAGYDPGFLRRLAMIRGLESMVMDGFSPRSGRDIWSRGLEYRFGVRKARARRNYSI
jgi:hypothetical protein